MACDASSPPRNNPATGELPFLEAVHLLRGLAAVMVVLDHSISCGGLGLAPSLKNVLGWYGTIGVVIFFVISGFVLPYSLHASYKLADYPRFLLRRLIRLEPVYLVGLAMAIVSVWLQAEFKQGPGEAWHLDWGRLLAHLLYLVPFTKYEWMNSAFWTLAVEFQFYLLIGLLFPLLRRASPWQAIFSIVAVSSATFLETGHYTLLMHLPLFGLGTLTYLLRTGHLRTSQYLTGVALLCALYTCHNPVVWTLYGGAAATVMAWWNPPRMKIRFLGSISYPLYVVHVPILTLTARAGLRLGQEDHLIWVAAISAAVIVAIVVHHFVEKPSVQLSRDIFRPYSPRIEPETSDQRELNPDLLHSVPRELKERDD
jgi:peptidoglycan/LPS O-acetylase OafA/YrhL